MESHWSWRILIDMLHKRKYHLSWVSKSDSSFNFCSKMHAYEKIELFLITSSTFLTSYSMLTHANIMETWWGLTGLTNMTSIKSIDFMLHYSSKTSFAYIIVAKVNEEVNIMTCKDTHWGKSLIFVQKSQKLYFDEKLPNQFWR